MNKECVSELDCERRRMDQRHDLREDIQKGMMHLEKKIDKFEDRLTSHMRDEEQTQKDFLAMLRKIREEISKKSDRVEVWAVWGAVASIVVAGSIMIFSLWSDLSDYKLQQQLQRSEDRELIIQMPNQVVNEILKNFNAE